MNDPSLDVLPASVDDSSWVKDTLNTRWGSTKVVSRGRVHQADQLPGYIAWKREEPVGLITYHIAGSQCEIVTIDSLQEGLGIGTSLITAVKEAAVLAGCQRLWLITTNDNTSALTFYQKFGFLLAALHRDAINEARKLKPGIPHHGHAGIAIRDEIELEFWL